MTKWIVAAITFGIFSTMFVIGSLISTHAVHSRGAPFLALASSRYGSTTSDRANAMAFAAFISGGLCLGSIAAGFRARRARGKAIDDSDAPSWTCPHCHQENPGNFEECWKCQGNRPTEVKL
jgi:hypothetical protein